MQDDEQPQLSIRFQNIVATMNLGVTLELPKIAAKVKNAEYNPKRFQAVIMRILQPRTTALIFSTGKVCLMLNLSFQLADRFSCCLA